MNYTAFLAEGAPPQPNDSKDLHLSALQTIVQAAANVELFTIPLYMCSMYSVVGSHQITGDNALYRGRWWPGAAKTADPTKKMYDDVNRLPINDSLFSATNNDIFNKIFKIFIEEMLHLQLVGNLAKVLGIEELSFTSDELMDSDKVGPDQGKISGGYNWHCYNGSGIIPHIVDLADTKRFKDVKVKLDALNQNQIELFKAIESPEDFAKKELSDHFDKYFPSVPFKDWTEKSQLSDLPMFGSIGYLYLCLWEYINMPFEDGTILLDYIVAKEDYTPYPQNDLFNAQKPGHPEAEFPGFDATLEAGASEFLLPRIADLINAITDQGEGGDVAKAIQLKLAGFRGAMPEDLPMAVSKKGQGSEKAISRAYKSYDDQGNPLPSASAAARAGEPNVKLDHEELFGKVEELMQNKDFLTWDQWHADPNNKWTAALLQSEDYANNTYKETLPKPEEVAAAMNRLKDNNFEANFTTMSQAAVGAIKGITTVLNKYWSTDLANGAGNPAFPFPSMGGSGDRVSICWAIFGKCPDIAHAQLPARDSKIVNHACQGLSLDPDHPDESNTCAHVSIYHTCKGSNSCRAEGGCGFVQRSSGGGNCSTSSKGASCGSSVPFSAPADNACGGLGGCAVPISASQLFPTAVQMNCGFTPAANMQLFDFAYEQGTIKSIPLKSEGEHGAQGIIKYCEGDKVYDKAWEAYVNVMKSRGKIASDQQPDPPPSSDFRLAFPPST